MNSPVKPEMHTASSAASRRQSASVLCALLAARPHALTGSLGGVAPHHRLEPAPPLSLLRHRFERRLSVLSDAIHDCKSFVSIKIYGYVLTHSMVDQRLWSCIPGFPLVLTHWAFDT